MVVPQDRHAAVGPTDQGHHEGGDPRHQGEHGERVLLPVTGLHQAPGAVPGPARGGHPVLPLLQQSDVLHTTGHTGQIRGQEVS